MHLNTSSRAKFFKIRFLDMKSNFRQKNKLQLKYFVQAGFSNTGLEMSGIFQDKSVIVWKFLEISVFRGGTFLSGFVKIFDTVPLPQLLI